MESRTNGQRTTKSPASFELIVGPSFHPGFQDPFLPSPLFLYTASSSRLNKSLVITDALVDTTKKYIYIYILSLQALALSSLIDGVRLERFAAPFRIIL